MITGMKNLICIAIHFFIISTTMVIIETVASSTRTTHPTTMPTIQPVEHPPEPDCAESTFTVVSGSVLWESTSVVDIVSGTVVSTVDVDIVTVVVGSENKIECIMNTVTKTFSILKGNIIKVASITVNKKQVTSNRQETHYHGHNMDLCIKVMRIHKHYIIGSYFPSE